MDFSDFPPSDTAKFENVGPTFSNFRPFLFYLSEAKVKSIAFIGFSGSTKSWRDCPFKLKNSSLSLTVSTYSS